MMSRNVSPCLTGSSDLGPFMPILVPSPPLSLSTMARRSASLPACQFGRAKLFVVRDVADRPSVSARDVPRGAVHQLIVVEMKGIDEDLGQALAAHLARKGIKVRRNHPGSHHLLSFECLLLPTSLRHNRPCAGRYRP